jgi:hypothetical protein
MVELYDDFVEQIEECAGALTGSELPRGIMSGRSHAILPQLSKLLNTSSFSKQ